MEGAGFSSSSDMPGSRCLFFLRLHMIYPLLIGRPRTRDTDQVQWKRDEAKIYFKNDLARAEIGFQSIGEVLEQISLFQDPVGG